MTYVVSGATGWMGRSALEVLGRTLAKDIELVGLSRHPGYLTLENGRKVVLIDYEGSMRIKTVSGLIHTAFPTQNLIDELGPEEYELGCGFVIEWLKKFTACKDPNWVIGISSGVLSETKFPNPRSIGHLGLYAKWKQLEELVLNESQCKNVSIGRLYAASGRFMTKPSKLALGDFILSGLKQENIVLKSRILGIRNYVDAEDFIETLIFTTKSNSRLTLDSDGIEISIPDLAKAVCGFFPKSKIVCDFDSFSEIDSYLPPKSTTFQELSAAAGLRTRDINDQISRTILGLR